MSETTALVSAIVAALVELPARLDRMERRQEQLLGAVQALAGGAAVGPVSLDAASPALKKSVATLRRLAAAGKLPGAVRVGRSWRIDLSAMRSVGNQDRIGELANAARAAS